MALPIAEKRQFLLIVTQGLATGLGSHLLSHRHREPEVVAEMISNLALALLDEYEKQYDMLV